MEARQQLATSLRRRVPTWRVAQAVLELGVPLAPGSALQQLAGQRGWQSGMHDDFDMPVPAASQVATWTRLFQPPPFPVDPSDGEHLRQLVNAGLALMGNPYGRASDALRARAWKTAAERKRLRFLRRLEEKAARLDDTWRLRHAQMQAKSRLAYLIDADACDDLTLAFCAYLAARANRRSMFVLGPQSRATDTIVEGLAGQLAANPATPWAQAALVRPVPDVLARCSQEDRGRLLGTFHAAMVDAAEALRGLYGHLPERMRAEMVMVKGVDSSRWNAYAGALNTMRSAWLNTALASGLDTRDHYLPGKAPRLMASDLAWWYRNSGQDLHEDTTLFAALPKPWEVVLGGAQLNRGTIERKAHELGVDVSTGWIGPRRGEEPEAPSPEPALVHGIAVADPRLAVTLRRCGVFSGREHRFIDELPDELVRVTTFDGKRFAQPVIGALDSEHVAYPS